jgi:lipopolysaccharide export LptBFGC system permease protein LptF
MITRQTTSHPERPFILFVGLTLFVGIIALVLSFFIITSQKAIASYIDYANEKLHTFDDPRLQMSFKYPSTLTIDSIKLYGPTIVSTTISTVYGVRDTLMDEKGRSGMLIQASSSQPLKNEETAHAYFDSKKTYTKEVSRDTDIIDFNSTTIDGNPALKVTVTNDEYSDSTSTFDTRVIYYVWTQNRVYKMAITTGPEALEYRYLDDIVNSIRITP